MLNAVAMDLVLEQPAARYKIAKLTIQRNTGAVEVGPALVATYDNHTFQFLTTGEVVEPICWECVEPLGALKTPAEAVKSFVERQLDRLFRALQEEDGGGAVALEIPPKRVRVPQDVELLSREVGA